MFENEIIECINIVKNSKNRIERNEAMRKIIEQYTPYLKKAVKKGDPWGEEDAFASALEGLYDAVKNFDTTKSNKFFSYAYSVISGKIHTNLRDGRAIRIPNTELKRLRKEENRGEYNRKTTLLSLNNHAFNEEGVELEERITYEENFDLPDKEEEAEKAEIQEKVVALLKDTVDRNNNKPVRYRNEVTHEYDGEMFRMYYGILGYPKYTVKEIREKMLQEHGIVLADSSITSRCESIVEVIRNEVRKRIWDGKNRTFALNNSNNGEVNPEDAILGPLFGGMQEKMPKDFMPTLEEVKKIKK